MKRRTTFRSASELFHADTCEPLKSAAASGDLQLAALGRGSYPGERLPRHELREVLMAGWWNAAQAQQWGLGWHFNEGIEIGYLSAGTLPFSVGEDSWVVEPGSLTITRPWQRHRVGNPNVPACHYSWLILDVGMQRPNQPWQWPGWLLLSQASLKRLTDMLRQNEQAVWRADPRIGICFARIDEVVAQGDGETNRTKLKLFINELIILLAELLESRNPHLDKSLPGSERTVRLFLESLRMRLDEPWTLDSLAAACGLGRTRFSSYCRKLTNVTPVEYLMNCRIDAATALLTRHPEMSVTEIAFRCGFQSSQYFSRCFHRRHGHSPSEHRIGRA